MCSTDFEYSKIWNEQAVRARKPHRCQECNGTIQPGEAYARVHALLDSWDTFVRCASCYFLCEAIETLECGDEGGSILWGGYDLEEEIRNMGHGDYDEAADEYAPNWAEVAFDAIRASRTPWRIERVTNDNMEVST